MGALVVVFLALVLLVFLGIGKLTLMSMDFECKNIKSIKGLLIAPFALFLKYTLGTLIRLTFKLF